MSERLLDLTEGFRRDDIFLDDEKFDEIALRIFKIFVPPKPPKPVNPMAEFKKDEREEDEETKKKRLQAEFDAEIEGRKHMPVPFEYVYGYPATRRKRFYFKGFNNKYKSGNRQGNHCVGM